MCLARKDLQDQLSRLQRKFYGFGRESLEPRIDRPTGKRSEQLKLHGEHFQTDKEEGDKSSDKAICTPEIVLHPMSSEI